MQYMLEVREGFIGSADEFLVVPELLAEDMPPTTSKDFLVRSLMKSPPLLPIVPSFANFALFTM